MPFASTLTAEATLDDVRTEQRNAAQYLIELRGRPADQRDDTHDTDVASAIDVINANDVIERALAAGERSAQGESRGPNAAFDELEERTVRSLGAQAFDTEEFRSHVAAGGGNFQTEVRTLLETGVSSSAQPFVPTADPTLAAQTVRRQRLFVRDLMSTGTTGLANAPYIKEVNSLANEGGAGMVAEGAVKPEVTMEFGTEDAPARKIAAWVPVTEEVMADAPTLRTYVDTRLTYMIMLREEAQVLNGTGTAPQLKGILNHAGLQTSTVVGGDVVEGDVPATLARQYAKIELVDGDPDGVVMNPSDYWTAVSTRHANQFDNAGGGNAPAAVSSISWGEPVVRTRAVAAGSAIVGSWRIGATILDRSSITIRVGDQHSDYFIHNKYVILAEKRTILQVHRPDFFVETEIDLVVGA